MRIQPSSYIVALMAIVPSVSIGCHTDVFVDETASAGDKEDVLSGSGADTSPGNSGETEAEPFNPLDYCDIQADDTIASTIYRCDGDFSSNIRFDYYGDPDVGIESVIVCLDLSDYLETDPGYVFTCYLNALDRPFGAEGANIETCCIPDSPDEAVLPLCRIDAAEELCEASSDNLNELRITLPKIPKLTEISSQLYNLNKHLASASVQEGCAKEFATAFVELGDFDTPSEVVTWSPGDNVEPDVGWPWLRNIDLKITAFHIDETVQTGSSCGDTDLLEESSGDLVPGKVEIDGELGAASGVLFGGGFAIRHDNCSDQRCLAILESFDLSVDDFELGGISFSDVHVFLSEEAHGSLEGAHLTIPGSALRLSVTGRALSPAGLVLGGVDLGGILDGNPISIDVGASGDMTAVLSDKGLAVTALEIKAWPVSALINSVESQVRLTHDRSPSRGPIR